MKKFKELFTENSEEIKEILEDINPIPDNVDKETLNRTIKSLKIIRKQEKKVLAALDVLEDLYEEHNRSIEKTMGPMRGPVGNQRYKVHELINFIYKFNKFYDSILAKYGKKA